MDLNKLAKYDMLILAVYMTLLMFIVLLYDLVNGTIREWLRKHKKHKNKYLSNCK